MEVWAILLAVLFFTLCVCLFLKNICLKKAIRKTAEQFCDIAQTDTNNLILLPSNDKDIKKLVSALNDELEELNIKRRKLQRSDAELKEAVTNIAHDIRTPLTATMGYLQLASREEKSGELSRYLTLIENRINSIKALTDELFNYSVLSSDTKLNLENVFVNNVLEECLVSAYGIFAQKNIEPKIELNEIKAERLLDRFALCRIFDNIISNAAKYSDGDFSVKMYDDGKITFENTARSLDEITVERLFDRFYTVETARKSTGLGLAIAKMLTERMGGDIGATYSGGRLCIWVKF